jgi:hypothetical protein
MIIYNFLFVLPFPFTLELDDANMTSIGQGVLAFLIR